MRKLTHILAFQIFSFQIFAAGMLSDTLAWKGWVSQSHTASSSSYFVDTNGNNANNGLTLATAWRTIGYALTNSSSGSTINVTGGQTFTEEGLTFQHPNTVLGSGGMPTIITASTNFVNTRVSYTTLNNLRLVGTGISSNTFGFYISPEAGYILTNVTMTYCEVTNIGRAFRVLTPIIGGRTEGLNFSRNSVHDGWWGAFVIHDPNYTLSATNYILNKNIYAGYNTISNIHGVTGLNSGYPFLITGFSNAIVENNVAHDCGENAGYGPSGGGPGGIVLALGRNGLVRSNIISNIHREKDGNTDGVGIDVGDLDSGGILVTQNFIYGCDAEGIYEWSGAGGITYAFNVLIDNGRYGGVSMGFNNGYLDTNNVITNDVFNNTILGAGIPFKIESSTLGTNIVANNIFGTYGAGVSQVEILSRAGVRLYNNDYYNLYNAAGFKVKVDSATYTTLAGLQSAGYETGTGFANNPNEYLFGFDDYSVSNYIVLSNSPIIGNAVNLSSLVPTLPTRDIIGTPVPSSGYNLGAFNTNFAFADITNGLVFRNFINGTKDYSGNGYDLVAVGSPPLSASPNNRANGAYALNGTTQWATNTFTPTINSWTISAWVRITNFATYPVAMVYGDASVRTFSLYCNPDQTIATVFTQGATVYKYIFSTGTVSSNTWTFIWSTYDGTTLTVGKNASIDSSTTAFSGNPDNFPLLSLGGVRDTATSLLSLPFTGDLSGVRIWNRALTTNELATVYTNGIVRSIF